MEEGVGRDVGGEEGGLVEPSAARSKAAANAARAEMQLSGQPVLDAALAVAAALFDFEPFGGAKLAAGAGWWRRRRRMGSSSTCGGCCGSPLLGSGILRVRRRVRPDQRLEEALEVIRRPPAVVGRHIDISTAPRLGQFRRVRVDDRVDGKDQRADVAQ